ncbi:MAG: spore coat associated protein CotJA [Clostridia bacterium]|nr:spore coat associated protein CotJA [Clostridia bacterium]
MLGGEPDGVATARNSRRAAATRGSGAQNAGRERAGQGAAGATFSLPDLYGAPLAMVYSPAQRFDNLYDPEEGLEAGTIFRDLDFPFYPTGCASCGRGR